jgi:hypothetical protein
MAAGACRLPGRLVIAAWLFLGLSAAAAIVPGAERKLDVSIAVFAPGIPAELGTQRDLRVFPRIREIEARLLPFGLRKTLASSGEWGAVRVVPREDPAAELRITAKIDVSDGERFALQVVAADATGRTWFAERFAGARSSGEDPGSPSADADVFAAIATRLDAVRDTLGDDELASIREIALLRYGYGIAPTAFGKYFQETDEGGFRLLGLPAIGDPMIERARRVRSAEHIIVDAVDEKYEELHGEVAAVYNVWQEYGRKSRQYQAADERWVASRPSDLRRGSFEALERAYDGYKWSRMTSQELDDMAVAFDNEVRPVIDRVENRIAELEDWVDAKTIEWNRLLEELFRLETRLDDE